MKKYKGFTLIELIVVIAILGILSTAIVPSVIKYRENANIQALSSDANLIHSSLRNTIANNPSFFRNFDEEDLVMKKGTIVDVQNYANTYFLTDYVKIISPDGSVIDDVIVTEYGQWQIMDIYGVKGHGVEATFDLKTVNQKGEILDYTMDKNGVVEN